MIPLDWELANCHLSQGADYTPMTGLEPSDLKARRALQYENESTFGNSSSAILLVNPSGKLGVLSSLVTDRTRSPASFRIACREQFFLAAVDQNIKRLVRFLSQGPKPIMAATSQ